VNGVRRGDGEAVADALEVLQQSLQDMRDTLKLLHGKPPLGTFTWGVDTSPSPVKNNVTYCSVDTVYVEPSIFYGIMRIYLSG
jgi:hypothetical protein